MYYVKNMDRLLQTIKRIIPSKLFKAIQPIYHFVFAWLAALLNSFPSEKLIVVGVTGTTGKTTSVYYIAKMLEASGYKTGFTSTAVFNDGEKEWLNDKKMTMLGRFFTQRMIRTMAKNSCQVAIVETTSEGIRQFRHRFINYDFVIFTGLYEEHIDSHGSFENYKKAKGELFVHLSRCKTKYVDDKKKVVRAEAGLKKLELKRIKKTIIANGDDEHASYFLNFAAERKFAYSKNSQLTFEKEIEKLDYADVEAGNKGISFISMDRQIKMNVLGEFNAANAMNAVSVGRALDLNRDVIKKGLESIKGVAGRLEKIDEGQNFTVIVDYAFEPKAVTKLYETLKLIPHENIIHVLGSCGGGRDVARRPKLGKLAGENSKYVIVTNEDPYDDDPETIIDQVAFGAEKAGKRQSVDLFKILDRRKAIKKSLQLAEKNDIVIITGKGSEQAIASKNGEKIPWDDRAVVRGLLSSASN